MQSCTACRGEIRDLSALRCPFCGLALGQGDTLTSAEPSAFPASSGVLGEHPIDGTRFPPGHVFANRFRIVCLLGRGGGGEVYRADDLDVGQPVALKLLSDRNTSVRDGLSALAREVRLARAIGHPNVCRVYDMGEAEGLHFLSMEYVDGETLAALHARIGRLPTEKAVDVARQLCAGVAAAHDRGVLHRDLKPSNIMLDGRGRVRIVDFGVAIGLDDGRRDIAGTPAYMAPEQVTGGPVSQRTDIYALGLVLAELFTGRALFDARTFEERTRSAPNVPDVVFGDEIDATLSYAIRGCLRIDPSHRPDDALQVAAALPTGDPIAAALQEGRVPRPDVIAATGAHGLLQQWAGWSLLAAVVGLGALVAAKAEVLTFSPADLPKSPEVLADRAAGILDGLNHGAWTDREFWFQRVSPPAGASTVQFVYRHSPDYLRPNNLLHVVTAMDPASDTEGIANVILDPAGRLITMSRLVSGASSPIASATTMWSGLFSAAALSPDNIVEIEPEWRPPVPYEGLAAWRVRDRASTYVMGAPRGRAPVYFDVRNGLANGHVKRLLSTGRQPLSEAAFWIVVFGTFASTIVLARRNLRAKEGDLAGAWKLGAVVASGGVVHQFLGAHHVPDVTYEVPLLLSVSAWWLLLGGLTWLAYISFEPYVRRVWPGILVSWMRLLSGRFRDPLVGRDALVGVLAGILTAAVEIGRIHLDHAEAPAVLVEPALVALRSPRHMSGMIVAAILNAILFAFVSVFTLVFVRMIVRATALALIVNLALVVLVSAGTSSLPEIALGIVIGGLFYAVVLRIGVLASLFMLIAERLLTRFPLTLDGSAWYFGSSLTILLLVLALAVAGFSIAVRRSDHVGLGARPLRT